MRERYRIPLIIAGAVVIYEASQFAFGKKTRDEIKQRDGNKSAISGLEGDLEAAHINHDKNSPNYDSPSNGRLLTPVEHLTDHVARAGRNGLSPSQNSWAIKTMQKKLKDKYRKEGDPE